MNPKSPAREPRCETSRALRVLLAHNFYREPGGEDEVFRAERSLLERAGHPTSEYTMRSSEIASDPRSLLSVACGTIWSRDAYRGLSRLIARERPDVAHFHNIVPLLSPSAYQACRDAGVPVVQTLHNYRLFCPAAIFYRAGRVCEECADHSLWRSIRYGCYRGSRAASATVASMLVIHRWRRTWLERVDRYVALSHFSKELFVRLGLPAEKIVVKPNFVDADPGIGEGKGGFALFVGRLTPEKGVRTLLEAWSRLKETVPLKIVGDGPEAPAVRGAVSRSRHIEWLGQCSNAEVLELIGDATILVFPSEWYEPFGRVVIEALARGTPVLAAERGAAAELVAAERTGLHFRPGDPDDLARQAERLLSDPTRLARFRRRARQEFERNFSSESNYMQLMSIYESVRIRR